jgi:predicted DNA-binding transcriptional regulator YafY
VIDLALKGPFKLEITYLGEQADALCTRTVEPYGVLFGLRCYLVCRVPDVDKRTRHLRIDRILKARRLNESFVMSDNHLGRCRQPPWPVGLDGRRACPSGGQPHRPD